MKPTVTQIREAARRYLKIVEWSDDDKCYVGSAPPLVGQSCHGRTESEVIKQLQVIVEEWVELLLVDGPDQIPARTRLVAELALSGAGSRRAFEESLASSGCDTVHQKQIR